METTDTGGAIAGESRMKKCTHLNEGHSIGNKPCVYCNGNYKNCPKQRLKCRISQACWKVK
jgi:hypothetical protein